MTAPDLHGLFAEALSCHGKAQWAEAVAGYRKVLALLPDCAEAYYNLGLVLDALGPPEAGAAQHRRAIALKPGFAEAYNALGCALRASERQKDAVIDFAHALELKPDFAEAYTNLGNTLRHLGRLDEAEAQCRRALVINPRIAAAHHNLALTLTDAARQAEAEPCYRRALELDPGLAEAHYNLGSYWSGLGRLEDAEAAYRSAIALKPDYTEAQSNLLVIMAVMARFDGAAILAEAKRFGEMCEPAFRQRPRHGNTPDPKKRLRIGILSPSLTEHVLAPYLEPVLRAHRRDRVSLHVYAHVPKPDATTERLKGLCESWLFVQGMSDDQVAARIEGDAIDILVDPMGHWAANRLTVFARKPAPIQVSYLCQGLTTGLSAMDYSIGDRWLNQGGAMQAFATERVIELPSGFQVTTFESEPPIGPPPSEKAGFVTFGSFNNPTKISDQTLALWSGVLRRLPTARLLLKGRWLDRPDSHSLLARRLEDHGIAPERVDLHGLVAGGNHLDWHNRIDIALDTLPFCGGRTTVDALWMGVPVVTLMGDTVVGRFSASHLGRMGAPELIASDPRQFADIAETLAQDPARLRHYRQSLRQSLRTSSLFDADVHVAELEDAYRAMWRRWCEEA